MIRRYQSPYEQDHWLYRPVWRDPRNHLRYVCYPLGISFIAIFVRWLWLKTYWYPFHKTELALDLAIRAARDEERRFWAAMQICPPLDLLGSLIGFVMGFSVAWLIRGSL